MQKVMNSQESHVLFQGIVVLLHAQAEPHLEIHPASGPSVKAVRCYEAEITTENEWRRLILSKSGDNMHRLICCMLWRFEPNVLSYKETKVLNHCGASNRKTWWGDLGKVGGKMRGWRTQVLRENLNKVWSNFPAKRSNQLGAQIVLHVGWPVQHGHLDDDTHLQPLVYIEIHSGLLGDEQVQLRPSL